MRPQIERIVIDPKFSDAVLPHNIAKTQNIAPEFMSKDELRSEERRVGKECR